MQAADLFKFVLQEPAISKEDIVEQIFRRSIGPLHSWRDPPEPPYLGDIYLNALEKLRFEREQFFTSVKSWLYSRDEDWLTENFKPDGLADSDLAKQRQATWVKEAERFHGGFLPWYRAGLGGPGLMADFDYWGKMSKYEVSEVTLLSLGLEPTPYFKERLSSVERRGSPISAANTFAVRQLEVFKRKFAPYGLPDTVYPEELTNWIRLVELGCHPAFIRMTEAIEARLDASNRTGTKAVEQELNADDKEPETRVLTSLTKIIVAMAIDGYGYDPSEKRSPIPKQIEGATDRLGISVSHNTIRKYLHKGESHLSEDK